MKENTFQKKLISGIQKEFPEAIILKNDSGYMQGIPDLAVMYEDKYVFLETKRSNNASHRPNQDYYINKINEMSYANFVNPENHEKVMSDIRKIFSFERRNYDIQ